MFWKKKKSNIDILNDFLKTLLKDIDNWEYISTYYYHAPTQIKIRVRRFHSEIVFPDGNVSTYNENTDSHKIFRTCELLEYKIRRNENKKSFNKDINSMVKAFEHAIKANSER